MPDPRLDLFVLCEQVNYTNILEKVSQLNPSTPSFYWFYCIVFLRTPGWEFSCCVVYWVQAVVFWILTWFRHLLYRINAKCCMQCVVFVLTFLFGLLRQTLCCEMQGLASVRKTQAPMARSNDARILLCKVAQCVYRERRSKLLTVILMRKTA